MEAAVAFDLDEGFHAGKQNVTDAPDGAILVEGAVGIARDAAVGEHGVLVDGAIEGCPAGNLQSVEFLVDSDRRAEGRVDGIGGEARLNVRATRIVDGRL